MKKIVWYEILEKQHLNKDSWVYKIVGFVEKEELAKAICRENFTLKYERKEVEYEKEN